MQRLRRMSTAVQSALANADTLQATLMQEQICLVNPDDKVIGPASKAAAHHKINGLPLHRAFSVFIFDSKNRMLIQQRSSKKVTFPKYWANACCSHPLYNADELGITPEQSIQHQQPLAIPNFAPRTSSNIELQTPFRVLTSSMNSPVQIDSNRHSITDNTQSTPQNPAETYIPTISAEPGQRDQDTPSTGAENQGLLHLSSSGQTQQDPLLGVRRAAIRKLSQELGIRPGTISLQDLSLLVRVHYRAMYEETDWGEHELDYVLFCRADLQIDVDPNEVMDVRYVNEIELRDLFRRADGSGGDDDYDRPKFSPWFRSIVDNFGWTWWEQLSERGPSAVLALTDNAIYRLDDCEHGCDWEMRDDTNVEHGHSV